MPKQSKNNKTILVIEDERATLQLLTDRLSSEGFNVIEARDGEEGLQKALKEHPDLILLDIILPKIDGMVLLKTLRSDEWGKSIPVIILTNINDTKITAEVLENGAYDFLVKTDWKLEDVVKKVKERLRLT